MTTADYNQFRTAESLGLIPDEENPLFLFSSTHTDLLCDILSGRIDFMELARMELSNRGLNEEGKFVGWKRA